MHSTDPFPDSMYMNTTKFVLIKLNLDNVIIR